MTWSAFFMVSMGKEDAKKAARIFVTMSAVGAGAFLMGTFIIFSKTSTLSISGLKDSLEKLDPASGLITAALFLVAAFIKSGTFPLHTWLRKTHGNAPNLFSPVLSGLLTKFGVYLALIVFFLFPILKWTQGSIEIFNLPVFNYFFAVLGGISILVGTFMAIRQEDAKMLIAYSSVSNAGYIILALSMGSALGFNGALLHTVNHAVSSAAMFLSMAAVYYVAGTTKMNELGGLVDKMPVTFAAYLIAIISVAGIPPMGGFVSKWLIYQGLIQKGMIFLSAAAFIGSIGSFLYVFKPLAAVFLGQRRKEHEKVKEAPLTMQIPLLFLSFLSLLFGVLPSLLIKPINEALVYIDPAGTVLKPLEFSFSEIKGAFGSWNSIIVFFVFVSGVIFAMILFYIVKKSRRINLTENYTAGEIPKDIVESPELYHYSTQFYKPLTDMYEKAPSVEDFWEKGIGGNVKKISSFFVSAFYSENLRWYLILVSILTIALFTVRR